MISVTKLLFMDEYYGDALRYGHNAHRMKSGAAEGMGPVVVWNSTRTCNLRCRHCYMESDGQKYDGELTTEEAKRFIDGLAEFRVPVLLFSGGEPLIRPDFFELAEYARDKGVRPTLSTNGTLITREVAQRIKDLARWARGCERYVPRGRGRVSACDGGNRELRRRGAARRAEIYDQPPQYHGAR